MNIPFLTIASAVTALAFTTSRQSTVTDSTVMAPHPPAPAPSPPAWIAAGDKKQTGSQQYLISTKIIEIRHEADSPEISSSLYSKVLSDPQLQVFLRAVSQRKGVDLMSAPSVIARSGHLAKVEVGRLMPYQEIPGDDAATKTEKIGVTELVATVTVSLVAP